MLAFVVKNGPGGGDVRSRQIRDPFAAFYSQGIALEPPLPPERLLQLLEENSIHASAVRAKADDAAARGFEFEPPPKPEGEDVEAPVLDKTLPAKLKDLLEAITPDYTFTEMLSQAATELEGIGWSAWEVVRNEDGTIGAIYPMPAHTLRATINDDKWIQMRAGKIRWFSRFGSGLRIDAINGGREFGPDDQPDRETIASEVIVFKTYTPRSQWYGIPKWIAAIPTIAELTAIREFNVSWFSSGGQTDRSMHITAADAGKAESIAANVKGELEANRGLGHTTLVTHGSEDVKVQVQQLTQQLRDGHFRFRRTDLIKEVLIVHNVPPYRVGWAELGSLGGSAAKEMLEAYQVGSVAPLQIVLEDRISATLFNPAKNGIDTGGYKFKLTPLDTEELAADMERAVKGVGAALITPNQGREMIGEERDANSPALDQYYFNGLPLGQAPAGPGGMPPGGPEGSPVTPPGDQMFEPTGTLQERQVYEPIQQQDRTQELLQELIAALRAALADPTIDITKSASDADARITALENRAPAPIHIEVKPADANVQVVMPEEKSKTVYRDVVRDTEGRAVQVVDQHIPGE